MKDRDPALRPLGKEFVTSTWAFLVNLVLKDEGIYGPGWSHTPFVLDKN